MSSDNRWDDEQFEVFDDRATADASSTRRPRKQGMSVTSIVIITILSLAGVTLAVCCGGGIWWVNNVKNSVVEDPETVRTRTAEIAEIQIPEGYEPAFAMRMNMFVFDMNMVGYHTANEEGVLMLMQMSIPFEDANNPQQQQQLENQFEQAIQQRQDGEEMQIEESETREFEIRGETVEFMFAKGRVKGKPDQFRQVMGIFPGRSGTGFLMLQVPEDAYDEEAIVKMIESIE